MALGAAIGVWTVAAWWAGSPLLIPPPRRVAATLLGMLATGELVEHVAVSLQRLGVGFLIGVPLGVALGGSMGWWPLLDRVFDPFVRLANSTPAIALIPFSLLWFGVTEAARYALLVYIVTLTLALNARHGVRHVPALRLKAARCLGVEERAAFTRVVIPSSFPAILAGIRTAIGLGVMVIVAAEMLGATSGLGYLIMESRQHYNVDRMFVGIVGLGTLSLILDRGFVVVVDRCLPRWSAERRVR
ncbi:MAG TPA: ABC transporter permease [Candidatus Tectomicrobia bacterium]|nr:ABC transporter permease [Candidatus Tectomicrobia bacterium]